MLTETHEARGGRHEAVCQQGHWALKGVGWGSIGEGNECGREHWLLKGMDCETSHRLGKRMKHSS